MVDGAPPALQVIVLGSGGGPREDNTTAFLVRATAEGWKKGSLLAVDAGVHLSAIARSLEGSYTVDDIEFKPKKVDKGPFQGLEVHHASASANAADVTGSLVNTYLITHPHLDHISGFVVNTAALSQQRQKRLAGLPATIDAFSTHIFNNVIWPNLSDENNGVGLVTYMRLMEGGSPAFGTGDAKGYVEVCEGLSVKAFVVSHGHCIERHVHRGSNAAGSPSADGGSSYFPRSASPMALPPGDGLVSRNSVTRASGNMSLNFKEVKCVYDSSAYFIRCTLSGKEVLIFGDVEPDSLSLEPRNKRVWKEAAPRITSGQLGGIFIECSYDDSTEDKMLFGHMAPRHLIQELKALAVEVEASKSILSQNGNGIDHKKRKRWDDSNSLDVDVRLPQRRRSPRSVMSNTSSRASTLSPRSQPQPQPPEIPLSDIPELESRFDHQPLKGVKVVIIHVKQKLDDGPDEGNVILGELRRHEDAAQLGCEFVVSRDGESVYL